MRTGLRVGVAMPGAPADRALALARAAEAWNLDTVWIGDPFGGADHADDTYVLVTAAGAAALTDDVRLGAFLGGRASAPILRLAEDIGVVDVISGGRLEVAFNPPDPSDPAWPADLDRLLGAWRRWPLPDGRTVCVTPAPVQPHLPVSIVEPTPGGDGRMMAYGSGAASHWRLAHWPLTGDLLAAEAVVTLRQQLEASGASGVVFLLEAGNPAAVERAVAGLGTVVAPSLRGPASEVEILALDARRWMDERVELHRAPDA